jgi:hypothetical protein
MGGADCRGLSHFQSKTTGRVVYDFLLRQRGGSSASFITQQSDDPYCNLSSADQHADLGGGRNSMATMASQLPCPGFPEIKLVQGVTSACSETCLCRSSWWKSPRNAISVSETIFLTNRGLTLPAPRFARCMGREPARLSWPAFAGRSAERLGSKPSRSSSSNSCPASVRRPTRRAATANPEAERLRFDGIYHRP